MSKGRAKREMMTFYDAVLECISNESLVREWNRLTGHSLFIPRSPIVAMIDEACGYEPDKKALSDFFDFVFEFIWLPLLEKFHEQE